MTQKTPVNYPLVYVCSPFAGDTEKNQENARRYSKFTMEQGYTPIAPHLLFPQFLDDDIPEERDTAIKMNLSILKNCTELWVFGDTISKGMSIEIDVATHTFMIPIRYFKVTADSIYPKQKGESDENAIDNKS